MRVEQQRYTLIGRGKYQQHSQNTARFENNVLDPPPPPRALRVLPCCAMLLEGSLCVVGSVRHHPTVGAYRRKRFGRGGVGSFGFNLRNPTYQPH